ncbi:MAG: hypothetical protein QG553_738 [Patescibacteria group bacterium]|nr:hypothetical protein [Patescibacteria group bacterium]
MVTRKSSVKAKTVSKPGIKMWQKLFLAATLLLLVTVAGTTGYAKFKQRDLQSKAAAYMVNRVGPNYDVSFAVCKTVNEGRTRVRGIVSRQSSKGNNFAKLTTFAEGKNGQPGGVYDTAYSNAWYWGAITAMELPVAANGWVKINYDRSHTDVIFMGFVPTC